MIKIPQKIITKYRILIVKDDFKKRTDDITYCKPDCEFLDTKNDKCLFDDSDLDWYDYYLANCIRSDYD